eukprot:gnl/Chilomastix_cuspidata/5505.p1 GENE.gnl/Chilomastix_cuspidata/5505~~gnl/Chilomastix_cuspidata/5505.p1  ORF type:complete len:314 (+),score=119.99 gnl/Chilomastix_cuspidata/5505:167-1108(+)
MAFSLLGAVKTILLLAVGFMSVQLIKFIQILACLIRGEQNLRHKYGGDWAFISGSTGGIGNALCEALAAQGMNLITLSRSQARLQEQKKALEARFGITVRTVAVDLTEPQGATRALKAAAKGVSVCAAFLNQGRGALGRALDTAAAEKRGDVALMPLATLELADFFVRHMHARGQRGLVCVTSSLMDTVPGPLTASYHSCKAWTTAFAGALAREAQPLGIDVLALAPGPVAGTRFYRAPTMRARRFGIVPLLEALPGATTARRVASNALRAAGRVTYCPCGFFGFAIFFLRNAFPTGRSAPVAAVGALLRARA